MFAAYVLRILKQWNEIKKLKITLVGSPFFIFIFSPTLQTEWKNNRKKNNFKFRELN